MDNRYYAGWPGSFNPSPRDSLDGNAQAPLSPQLTPLNSRGGRGPPMLAELLGGGVPYSNVAPPVGALAALLTGTGSASAAAQWVPLPPTALDRPGHPLYGAPSSAPAGTQALAGLALAAAAGGRASTPPEVATRQKDYVDEAEMNGQSGRKDMLWELCATYLPRDVPSLQRSVVRHVEYTLARRRYKFDRATFYQATAHSVRDRLIERWTDTQQFFASKDCKKVYYLSMEFLVGRSLQNAMANLGLKDAYSLALHQLGYDLESLTEEEKDPALGNGGLGRLASCFLDSLATLNYNAWGYGIRYKYGMFEQRLIQGHQVEFPDYWLTRGNPWEVERLDVQYPVRLYGHVTTTVAAGRTRFAWEGGEVILAVAHDTPVPGHATYNTNNLRLWSSRPSHEFDLAAFNSGNYDAAIEAKERSESISSVLYPNDSTDGGKELRLKQQFFFVSATLQDVLRRFKKRKRPLSALPDKVAIQLNDTHPSIGIPELMRLLLDENGLEWDDAWAITQATFAYTNHTILPEALERWPVPLLEALLPRHMQIIFEINHRFLQVVERRWPGDTGRLRRMSIIEESNPKMALMAHLAIVGSHTVNGVAKIHTQLLTRKLFPDFYELWPSKFQNKTNGVTPRRWILSANRPLAALITRALGGDAWVLDAGALEGLAAHAASPAFRAQWRAAKNANKARLAEYVWRECGVRLPQAALFDMHIKRIHEYKRQLLNILYVIHRYSVLRRASPAERAEAVPRAILFAGKAAPSYVMAKGIIHFASRVAERVNADPAMADLLRVVFVPNYSVSVAELMIPASDVSQHISTAGMEASGTSNMKFAMNGGLLIGTMDGANIEIAEAIGPANMFVFGADADRVEIVRAEQRIRAAAAVAGSTSPPRGDGLPTTPAVVRPVLDDRLQAALDCVQQGAFGPPAAFRPLLEPLLNASCPDHYLLAHDWPSYLTAQAALDAAYMFPDEWARRAILSVAAMGRFSSDRTVAEYAETIWRIERQPFIPPGAPGLYGGPHAPEGGGHGSGGGSSRPASAGGHSTGAEMLER